MKRNERMQIGPYKILAKHRKGEAEVQRQFD